MLVPPTNDRLSSFCPMRLVARVYPPERLKAIPLYTWAVLLRKIELLSVVPLAEWSILPL